MSLTAVLLLLLSQTAAIHGTIRADSSLEPIPHATVRLPQLGRTAVADEHGYYVLSNVRSGTWTVRADALGYRSKETVVEVPSDGQVTFNLTLTRRPVRLSPLEVEGERGTPGEVRIDPRTIAVVPALVEADVLRTAQLLPAIQQTSDFSSALYVRGGAADQTLVTLDGAPLFNPYHLGGVFSAIDPGAVASIDVLPGAFRARAGGDRLSGAVHIQTRDGSRDRIHGQGGVGLVSARASVDGPLPGGDGSFLLSVRRTYLDVLSEAVEALGLTDTSLPYGFTDAHAKLTHDVGELGRLSASFYTNGEELRRLEEFGGSGRDRFTWGSHTASIEYRQPLGGAVLGELQVAYGDFGTDVRFFDRVARSGGERLEELADVNAFMRDFLVATHLTWHESEHEFRAGARLDAYRFCYGVERSDEHFFADLFPEFRSDDELRTVAAYLEDEWSATDALDVRVGGRMLHAPGIGTELMPRIGTQYALSSRLSVSAGAGRYAQAIHGLRDEEALMSRFLAYELMAPVPARLRLQTASDVVLGARWRDGRTRVRIDGYAKRLDNLILPPLPSDPTEAPLLKVDDYRSGTGSSYGLELLARHERENGSGVQASYALRVTEYALGDEEYPPGFSRRHTVDVVGTVPWDADGSLSARLQFKSGQPFTPIVGAIRPFDHHPLEHGFSGGSFHPTMVLGEHNSKRLPFYWRVDVSARKHYDVEWFGRETTLTLYGQILNVFNVKNVLLPKAPNEFGGFGAPRLRFTPQLPILPSFGVEWSF